MTDLELLNRVIADMAKQLAAPKADDATASQQQRPTGDEIKDPAVRFFDAMMQPRDPAKIQKFGLLKKDENQPPAIDV